MQTFLLPDAIAQVHDRKFLSSSFRASSSFTFVWSFLELPSLDPRTSLRYLIYGIQPLPLAGHEQCAPRTAVVQQKHLAVCALEIISSALPARI